MKYYRSRCKGRGAIPSRHTDAPQGTVMPQPKSPPAAPVRPRPCRHCGKPLEPAAPRCAACGLHQRWYGNVETYLPLAGLVVAILAMLPDTTRAVVQALTPERPELVWLATTFDDTGLTVQVINRGPVAAVISHILKCSEDQPRPYPVFLALWGTENAVVMPGQAQKITFQRQLDVSARDPADRKRFGRTSIFFPNPGPEPAGQSDIRSELFFDMALVPDLDDPDNPVVNPVIYPVPNTNPDPYSADDMAFTCQFTFIAETNPIGTEFPIHFGATSFQIGTEQ
jgi:hypothetical protein